ncbi:MAG: FAD-dependent oxidoreductase [Marinifilaceae bacterium]
MNNAQEAYNFQKDKGFQDLLKQANKCLECGRCSGGCPMAYFFPEHFNPRHLLERLIENPEDVINSIDIWFCASCYTCNKHCPQGLELPKILTELRKIAIEEKGLDQLHEALKVIQEKIPFAESFFRVCFHPERFPIDKEVIDELIERKTTDRKVPQLDNRIAIIGSGPAGLYASYLLRLKGFQVSLFEAADRIGGMFRRCIPEYRLDDETIDCDVRFIESLGVDIHTNTAIGQDMPFDQLFRDGFEAVFVATGAHGSLKMNLDGEDLPEVMGSLHFLEKLKTNNLPVTEDRIVVVGGGNTSIDSAMASIKYGAKEVTVLYRRSKDEMPADESEINIAEKEGIQFQYLVSPIRFIGKEKLESVEVVKMELGYPDLSGRRRPIQVENSNFLMKADKIVVAIGDKPMVDFLPKEIQLNGDGTIAVNPINMATNLEGVFAGGDAVLAAGNVSEGMMTASKAVNGIINYLEKKWTIIRK